MSEPSNSTAYHRHSLYGQKNFTTSSRLLKLNPSVESIGGSASRICLGRSLWRRRPSSGSRCSVVWVIACSCPTGDRGDPAGQARLLHSSEIVHTRKCNALVHHGSTLTETADRGARVAKRAEKGKKRTSGPPRPKAPPKASTPPAEGKNLGLSVAKNAKNDEFYTRNI